MNDNESKLVGVLWMLKNLNLKPNFSELEREYGINRHTISDIYRNGGAIPRKERESISKWDEYYELICFKMEQIGATKIGVFKALEYELGDKLPGTYSGFKSYTLRKGLSVKRVQSPHVLYETDPGEQLQVDWKENLSIELQDGTIIEFNVFSATLGYSREHIFIYSSTKTTEDFIRCIIETFRRLGGITRKVKTDNMSAIVSCRGTNKQIFPRISQLFRDLDVKLELSRVRTPETKGKDENSNKFINRIKSMNGLFKTEEELINYIEQKITSDANSQINTGTRMPPLVLFKKEKEYLRPIPNEVLLESYLQNHKRTRIDATLLFYWDKNRYSVPANCLGKYVDIYCIENTLYVYHEKRLAAKHNISQYPVNYDKQHYIQGLAPNLSKKSDIESMAEENLRKLKGLKR